MNLRYNSRENALPKGVTDFLPDQAEKISYIKNRLSRIFKLWGFRDIIPAMLEFEEVLFASMDDSLKERSFRFDDRQSHRLLAIPPDITPQIARIEAMRMGGYPLPHRLSYHGRVLRHVASESGRSREVYQSGVELIGLESPEADAEMIAIAVEALRSIGFSGFKIDLGHVDFYKGIIASSCLESAHGTALQEAIARKDLSTVNATLAELNIADSAKEEIAALPRLFGGTDVIEKAYKMVSNDISRRALDNLAEVVDILAIHGIKDELTIDLGEIRGLAYHTGLTFEGFLPGIGEPVCSGGRYDNLMERFGRSCPATGFTFNLLNLLVGFEKIDNRSLISENSYLIFNSLAERQTALSLAASLRSKGYRVARDIIRRDYDTSLDYAKVMDIKYMVVVDELSVTDGTVALISSVDGSQMRVSVSSLTETDVKFNG